jgi:hypothetical protein
MGKDLRESDTGGEEVVLSKRSEALRHTVLCTLQ